MSAPKHEGIEVSLARVIGRAWGDLGGSAADPRVPELARAVMELAGAAATRPPRTKRGRLNRQSGGGAPVSRDPLPR